MTTKTDSQNKESQHNFKIGYLSNPELLARFGKLVQTERKITHLVLECIAEIDSRRLYLDKAYPSLYEFLVQEFGYSPSAALRRIESARLLREVPELAAKIESGSLNLSQLSKVQQAVRTVQKIEDRKLDSSEKKELLLRIENTTQQQTEVILSQALSLPIFFEDKEKSHRDESVTLTITLSKEQMALLKQAQDLIAHAVPEKKWADTLAYLAQKEIDRRTKTRKDTSKEASRKEHLGSPKIELNPGTKTSNIGSPTPATGVNDSFKPYISSRQSLLKSKKKIVLNQQRCCQYKDKITGKTCGSTRYLQIDHRQSVWAGGSNELHNLQVLCAQHNQYKYRQESFWK